jgi:hypothetical protein
MMFYVVNSGLVPQYGEDHFFPNPSQFNIHQPSYHMTLVSDDDSAVKQSTKLQLTFANPDRNMKSAKFYSQLSTHVGFRSKRD